MTRTHGIDKIIYKIEDIYAEINGIVLILLNYKSKRLLSVSSVLDFSPKIRMTEIERKKIIFLNIFSSSHINLFML